VRWALEILNGVGRAMMADVIMRASTLAAQVKKGLAAGSEERRSKTGH
jgi:hypothetical protein